MQMNGDLIVHIRERMERSNIVMRQICEIGERMFRGDIKRWLMLFVYVVVRVMLYGLEPFGWEERMECEIIQQKYIR